MAPPTRIEAVKQKRLLPSILWPLGFGSLLVAVFIGMWLGMRADSRLTDMLYSQAKAIALGVQASAGLLHSTTEVQNYLGNLPKNIEGLESISIITADGVQLASSGQSGDASHRTVYTIPIGLHFARTNTAPLGEAENAFRYFAVVALDNRQAVVSVRTDVWAPLVAGLALLFGFCYLLLRHYVVKPIADIHTALERSSAGLVKIPVLRADELGELALVLEDALDKIQSHQTRFNSMIANVPGCFYRFDGQNFTVLMVSPQCEELTGYPVAHFSGVDDLLGCLAEDRQRVFREVNQACLEGRSWSIDHVIVKRNGERRWGNTTGKAIYGCNGEILFIDGLVIDTTERVRQQQALRVSEQRYQRAIQSSSDGIWEWRRDTRELYVSQGFKQPLGIAEGAGLSIDNFLIERLHEEDRVRIGQHVTDCLQQGINLEAEFRLRSNDGRFLWFLAKGQCIRDEAGTAIGLAGSVAHISKRKQAEKSLKDTATQLTAVLSHIADGILLLDGKGRIKSANPAIERLLDCSERDLKDLAFSDFLSLQDIPTIDWQALAGQRELTGTVVPSRGGRIPVEAIARAMQYGDEEMYTLVVRDISERKRTERELIKAKDSAEAATRAKSNFLATMSHEIRTPLNGVLGMTQILMDMGLTDEQQETARIIYASGQSLLTIVNDILDFSKIEAGKLQIEAIPFDLRSSIGEVLELLSGRAVAKNLQIFIDHPVDIDHRLCGDPGRIHQVLMNLIGNAIKFTEQGHIVVRMEQRRSSENRVALKFSIEDTGIGIGEAARSRLFESFTQADASTTRRFGGTGLGLAISRQIVTLMGGEIGVESVPGEGSTFWFGIELPLDIRPVETVVRLPDLAGRRVLIGDDNEVGCEILRSVLTRLGMQVSIAASAADCLDLLKSSKAGYDIALLDYPIALLDGDSLIECIRANPTWNSMKLLMLTSSDRILESQRMLDLGLTKYLVKPVQHEPLFHALSELLIDGVVTEETPVVARKLSVPDSNLAAIQDTAAGGPRVLLAEDSVVNQKVAVRMLEKLGCVVDVATNGGEAIAMWQKCSYAMVFMDCQMPEIDGYEATRRIRARESRHNSVPMRRTPIVAMTANAMDGDEQSCLAAGMDDYAAKPVKSEILAAMVAKWSLPTGNRRSLR